MDRDDEHPDRAWAAWVEGDLLTCRGELDVAVRNLIAATASPSLGSSGEWSGELDDLLTGLVTLGRFAYEAGAIELAMTAQRHVIALAAPLQDHPGAVHLRASASISMLECLLAKGEGVEGVLLMKSLEQDLAAREEEGWLERLREVVRASIAWAERRTGWDLSPAPEVADDDDREGPPAWAGLAADAAVLEGRASPLDDAAPFEVPRTLDPGLHVLVQASNAAWAPARQAHAAEQDRRFRDAADAYAAAIARTASLARSFPASWEPRLMLSAALRWRAGTLAEDGAVEQAALVATRAVELVAAAQADFPEVVSLQEGLGWAYWTRAWVRSRSRASTKEVLGDCAAGISCFAAACIDPHRQPQNVHSRLALEVLAQRQELRAGDAVAALRRQRRVFALVRELIAHNVRYPALRSGEDHLPRFVRALHGHLFSSLSGRPRIIDLQELGEPTLPAPAPATTSTSRRAAVAAAGLLGGVLAVGAGSLAVGLLRRSRRS